MRRFLVLAAVLAVLFGVSTPVGAQDIAAMSFEQLTVSNTAGGLSGSVVNVGGKAAARCVGVLETATIRIRVDGTVPTASTGTLVPVGAFVDIRGVDNVRRFSAIRTGASSGVLPLTCFPSPAETTAAPYLNLTPTPAVNAAGLSADGTVSLPSIAFAADPDSGLYRIGANNVGAAVNGTKVLDISTTGLGVVGTTLNGDGTVSLPGVAFTSDPDSGLYRIGANNLGVAVNGAKVVDVATTGVTVTGNVTTTGGGGVFVDDSTVTKTVTSATPSTERLLYSKLTLTPSTTTAVAAGGSLAGMRGEFNFTTGKTFTDGFVYGVQGKSVFAGTLNESSAARVTGVLGQTDVTGATLTAGQVSGVWADLQGNATNTQTFPLRVTNSMSSDARALGFFYGTASYLFEVSDAATGKFVESTVGTAAGQCAQTGGLVATKALKITANGVDYWIPLCTAK